MVTHHGAVWDGGWGVTGHVACGTRPVAGNPTAPKGPTGSQQEHSSLLLLSCGITSSGELLPRLLTVTVPDSTSTVRAARWDLPIFTCTQGRGSGVVPTLPSSDTGVLPCPQPHLKVLHGQGPGSWQGGHGHAGQCQVVPCHCLLQRLQHLPERRAVCWGHWASWEPWAVLSPELGVAGVLI